MNTATDPPDQTIDEALITKGSQSPFLEGTNIQFAWDSTSLGLMKTCPRLYQYTMIDGWESKGQSVHLRFGIEYHTALQEYDVARAKGVKHEAAIQQVVGALVKRIHGWVVDEDSKAGKYKNKDTLVSLVVDYLDHFSANDPATTYIRADGTAAVELSFRFELDFGPTDDVPYLLSGHLDRVVELNGQLLVMDHKTTTSTLSTDFFHQWEPSNQMTLYTLAGKTVLGAPIKGVLICGAQIKLTEPHSFVRGFTYRTDDQLNEWLDDLQLFLSIAKHYATENYWPMNDTSCDKYGGCKFRGVCSKSPASREKFLRADFIKKEIDERWNPLRSR